MLMYISAESRAKAEALNGQKQPSNAARIRSPSQHLAEPKS